MKTFTDRDLSERTGDLICGAEKGITLALAVHLFDEEQISLGMAAQLVGMSREDFTKHLAHMGVAAIRTTSAELAQEMAAFEM